MAWPPFLRRLLSAPPPPSALALPAPQHLESTSGPIPETAAPRSEGVRADAWWNPATGLGTTRDKRMFGRFSWNPLTYEECRDMYRGDPHVRRAVNLLPDEMTRAGFRVTVSTGDRPTELARWVNGRMTELGFRWKLRQAARWARAYGGAGILIGARDGAASPREPLRVDSLEGIDFLNVFDVSELRVERWYASPFRDKYGDPAMYRITPRFGGTVLPAGYELVHASRILRFNGVELSREEEQQNYGWGDSVIVSLFDTLSAWAQGHSGAAHLLTDASQAVFKWKGLAALFNSKKFAEIQQRATMIDSMRSLLRAIIVDPEEGFERVATQFAGIPDTLDRLTLQLTSALGYPVTIFMGRAPSGINTNGDADIQSFRAVAMSGQTSDLQPHVERMARMLFACPDSPTRGEEPEGWGVKWESLEILSQKERAELEKTVAEKDVAYIQQGVFQPAEVAVSRYGGEDGWTMDTTIDLELRENMPPPSPTPPGEPAPAPTPEPTPAPPAPGQDPAPSPTPPKPPTPGAPPAAGEPLASTALNGAQVTSAVEIVAQVARREIPRESGVAMIELFFNRRPDEAERIMGPVGVSFFATPPADPPAPPPAPGAEPPPSPTPAGQ